MPINSSLVDYLVITKFNLQSIIINSLYKKSIKSLKIYFIMPVDCNYLKIYLKYLATDWDEAVNG